MCSAAIYLAVEGSDDELLLAGSQGAGWDPPPRIAAPAGPVESTNLGEPPRTVDVVQATAGGGLVGALVIAGADQGAEFLRTLGAQLGLALGNAQRLERESESVRRLTELARLRSSLISGVSHELRTPLTTMIGLAQTMRMRELPPEMQSTFLDQILRQTERLKGLVGDLLDETRLESGILRVDIRPVRLATLLHEVADSFVDIEQTLIVECEPGLPPAEADPHRLEQVLVNLVHNATKYGPPGSNIRLRAIVDGPRSFCPSSIRVRAWTRRFCRVCSMRSPKATAVTRDVMRASASGSQLPAGLSRRWAAPSPFRRIRTAVATFVVRLKVAGGTLDTCRGNVALAANVRRWGDFTNKR